MREPHSYPSKVEILIYPGGISEMEMILAYGSVCFASKVGHFAGNHFLTITGPALCVRS